MHNRKKTIISFIVLLFLFCLLVLAAMNTGSIRLSFTQILKGLFVTYDPEVAIIYDLRFPRIIIAALAGAALAVSGCLFQACMKNPIADAGVIGVSSGASFVAVLVVGLFPSLYFFVPMLSFIGGLVACFLVYLLSWKGGLNPLRVILVGVAINAVFTGLTQAFNTMTGRNRTGVAAIANANISQKTWDDVYILTGYVALGLVLALLLSQRCNLLGLSDQAVRGLGVNITITRIIVSIVSVLLASISTAVVGVISFLGLIVPHIARLIVGSDHKVLLPFSILGGATLLLLADTIGRTVAAPFEISASILLSILGGPMLIILLRKSEKTYGV